MTQMLLINHCVVNDSLHDDMKSVQLKITVWQLKIPHRLRGA